MTPTVPAHPDAEPVSGRYQPGELIHDKYQLIRRLGQGGMGTVWVAENTVLQVNVAIKLITLSEQGDRDETAERLLREARAAARLDHPAIVRVFDFGKTRHGDPFIVMELLHGESLADILNRDARLAAIEAVRVMLPIADALASAHDKGVVHRDVKPENVILATTEDGKLQPKLLDFGIASLQETNTRITQEKRLTREGSVVGTPAYMSPEQAMGKSDLDQRTDVWSFGVMLYELTTGKLPFDADNYNALLYEIINQPPEPCMVHAAGDEELWQSLEVALRKKPEERWGSMRAFGEALAIWLVDQGIREDICSASLRSAWLDSGALAKASPSGDTEAAPKSDVVPVLPPPARPPRTGNHGAPARAAWPLRATFLVGCFVAGLFTVGELVSTGAPPSQSSSTARESSAEATVAALEAPPPGDTAAAESLETGKKTAAHNEVSGDAVPLDQVLGEAESEQTAKKRRIRSNAASKPRSKQPRKQKAKPKSKTSPDHPVDFGF